MSGGNLPARAALIRAPAALCVSLLVLGCSKGDGARNDTPDTEDTGAAPSVGASPVSSVIVDGSGGTVPVVTGGGGALPVESAGVNADDEPRERTPFEPVELELDSSLGDLDATNELAAGELMSLCEALSPAIESECELFAIGAAIERDALGQVEFETACAAARVDCVLERLASCAEGLARDECEASVGDAQTCYEGRANAKGEAVSALDGLAFTCEDEIFTLLEAAWAAGQLEPAELDDVVADACERVDPCVWPQFEVPAAELDGGLADAAAQLTDAGAPRADAASTGDTAVANDADAAGAAEVLPATEADSQQDAAAPSIEIDAGYGAAREAGR